MINHRGEFKNGVLVANLNGNARDIRAPSLENIANTGFDLRLEMNPFLKTQNDIKVEGHLKQEQIQLTSSWTNGVKVLSDLSVNLMASLKSNGLFNLETLEGTLTTAIAENAIHPKSLIRFSADATGNLRQENIQAQGSAQMVIPKNFPVVSGHHFNGTIEVPWTIAVSKREFKLEADFKIEELNWRYQDLGGFSGMQGTVPVSEKFFWDGKKFQFSGLLSENPFERADFSRIQPLLLESSMFKIEKIQWENKSYGPFLGFFTLKQNRLYSHQFNLNMDRGLIW